MLHRATVLAPSSASLPDSLRIPSPSASLVKSLGKLSRSSLIALALQWLGDKNAESCKPYLRSRGESRHPESEEDIDDTSLYDAASSIEELRDMYEELKDEKGGKREIIDRILEGDWRHGLSLRQVAMVDALHMELHPTSNRWTALKLQLTSVSTAQKSGNTTTNCDNAASLPRFHVSSFLKSMQREISPLVKAHYHVHRLQSLPLTLIRMLIFDSPYQLPRKPSVSFTDPSRIIYLAFPDSTPFIYSSLVSVSGSKNPASGNNPYTTDVRTLRRIVNDAIPKALSRPKQRYILNSTFLTAKSLHTLLALRGPWRSNSANGAFAIFADAVTETGPLEPRLCNSIPFKEVLNGRPSSAVSTSTAANEKENQYQTDESNKRRFNKVDNSLSRPQKKQKQAVMSRFGTAGDPNRTLTSFNPTPIATPQIIEPDDTSGNDPTRDIMQPPMTPNPALDRLRIRLQDPPVASEPTESAEFPKTVATLIFSGTDVVAGLRQLAELGVIDAARMPSWMTGEEGVSSATIKNGRRVLE